MNASETLTIKNKDMKTNSEKELDILREKIIPNPGSEQAVEKGCTCPRMDNAHGRGYYCDDGSMFVYNMDCLLHKDLKIKK